MVKKRKPVPITFPRVKVEVKSEAIPGIDDARDRLKGALQELLDQSGDSSLSSSDDATTETDSVRPTPVKRERTSAPSTPRLPKTMKRRRRRDSVAHTVFHHTFVMKMFDRSVDLAQFDENSPLYAVCRGWMANQPRNLAHTFSTNNVYLRELPGMKQQKSSSPEHSEEDAVKEEMKSDEEDAVEDVWVMPQPTPLPTDSEELRKLKIPSPVPRQHTKAEGKAVPSRDMLLKEHLKHWGKVNRSWRAVAQKNELRYKGSVQILRTMYKRAQ